MTPLARLRRGELDSLTVACPQCGRLGADVLRLTGRELRGSCRRCRAVFRSRDVSAVRELAAAQAPAPTAAAPAPPSEDERVAPFVPAPMLAWLRLEGRLDGGPDREKLELWYARFDNFTRQARTSKRLRAEYESISDVPLDEVPERLPSFAHVVAVLHRSCYDREAALRTLGANGHVRERVEHAARWLASPAGRGQRWLDDSEPPTVDPDPDDVRALLEAGALPETIDADRYRVLQGALFGTERGPSLRALRAHFSPARIEAALRAYVGDGSRPLRDEVVASLRAAR